MPQLRSFLNHTGGLKTNVSPFFMDNDETPNALNVEYANQLGAITKASQYSQFGNGVGDARIQGIFPFEDASSNRKLFMATNGVIYEYVAGTWTSRKTGLSDTNDFHSVMFYNRLYVAVGSGIQYTDDGTTWNALSAAPQFITVFKNRLYGANFGGDNRNRVAFSDLGDGTMGSGSAFGTNNTIDTIEGVITGIHATYNAVYTFTLKDFWSWDESYFTKIDNVGCLSARSIASGNGQLFFTNRDGVWVSTGGKAQMVSRPIQYWWDGIDADNLSELNGAFYKNEYYLWIGDSQGQSDVVLVYNTLYRTWRVLTGWTSRVMAVWTDGDRKENLYFGRHDANSLVYKADAVYTQAESPVAATYDYAISFPAGPDKESQGLSIHCWAQSNGNPVFQILYALDFEDTYHELAQWVLQGKGYPEYKRIGLPPHFRGRAVQFRIVEATSANAWTWHGMRFYFDGEQGTDD